MSVAYFTALSERQMSAIHLLLLENTAPLTVLRCRGNVIAEILPRNYRKGWGHTETHRLSYSKTRLKRKLHRIGSVEHSARTSRLRSVKQNSTVSRMRVCEIVPRLSENCF